MRILPVVLFLLLLFAPPGLAAAEPLLLVTDEYYPYVSSDANRPGLLHEVVVAAFREAGVKVRIRYRPWRRCALMVEEGTAFGAFPYKRLPRREAYALFTDPVAECHNVFFYLKGRLGDFRFKDLEALRRFRIAGTSGHFYEAVFKEKGLRVDYAPGEASGIRKVWTMRADLFAANEVVGRNLVKRIFPNHRNMFGVTRPWNTNFVRVMVSRRFPEAEAYIERFNRGLAAIRANGVYDRISARYSGL